MKWMQLLIWLTQLSISVVAPLGGFTLLSVWLRQRFDLGVWVVLVGVALGVICAVEGLRSSLRSMEKLAKADDSQEEFPVSFNDHE